MKYEYVHMEYKNTPPGSAELEMHREVINKQTEVGNRYIGYIPVKIGPSGKILSIDLIFEKNLSS